MKIEWLVTNVTPAGALDRAERAILGVILFFMTNSAAFVAGKPFCDVGTPSRALICLLWVIY